MALENLANLTIAELLSAHSTVIDELKRRGVVRSKNNPTGDYAEWLASSRLGLTLATKSAKGFDATDSDGLRYQIKGRRSTPDNPSTQLGVIRNLDACDFDFLIAIVFNADWQVLLATKIPHRTVTKQATFRKHQNGHIMHMRPSALNEPDVEDITSYFSPNMRRQAKMSSATSRQGHSLNLGESLNTNASSNNPDSMHQKIDRRRALSIASQAIGQKFHAASTRFANMNAKKNVWWIDIPTRATDANSALDLLLANHDGKLIHHLQVPASFFIDHVTRFCVVKDRTRIELSCLPNYLFQDVRPGAGQMNFSGFFVRSIVVD
jgi:hypothetical protein